MIVLFADPALKALALAVAQSLAIPLVAGLAAARIRKADAADQKAHFERFIGPLIADNFTMQPSSGPAFIQMGSQFYEELKRNSVACPDRGARLSGQGPWGEYDPYLGVAMEGNGLLHFKNGSFHLYEAGPELGCIVKCRQ